MAAPESPKEQGELGYAPAPEGSVAGSMVGETKPPADTTINTTEGVFEQAPAYQPPPPPPVYKPSYDPYPGRDSYSPYIPPGPGMAETTGPGRILQRAGQGWQGSVLFTHPHSALDYVENVPFQAAGAITSGGLETINQLFGRDVAGATEALLPFLSLPEAMYLRQPMVTQSMMDRPPGPPAPLPRPVGGADFEAPPWASQNQLAPEPPPPPAPSAAPAAPTPPVPPAPAPVPTTMAEAKAVAQPYYDYAKRTGGTLAPSVTDATINDVASHIGPEDIGRAAEGPTPVTELLNRIEPYRGTPMSLDAYQNLDQSIGRLLDAPSARDPQTGRLNAYGRQLLDIQDNLRERVTNAGEADVVGGKQGFDALVPARAAWSQAMKLGDLERIQTNADLTDNPATAIKTGVKNLINSKRYAGYSDDEKAALQDAANRGLLGGALNVFGCRIFPLIAAATGEGLVGGLVRAAGVHAAGVGLRSLAGSLQANRLMRVREAVGANVPPPLEITPPPEMQAP